MNKGKRKTKLWILWLMTTVSMLMLVLLCSDRFQGWSQAAAAGTDSRPTSTPTAGLFAALTDIPEATGVPETPSTSEDPTATGVPENPSTSGDPTATGVPENPSTSGDSTVTGVPTDSPALTDIPEASVTPELPTTAEEPAVTGAPENPTTAEDPAATSAPQIDPNVPPSSLVSDPNALLPGIVGAVLPQPEKRVIDPDKPMIALTFDDGPYRSNTETVVELFEQYDGRATFFVVGYHVEGFGACMQYAYMHGFQIGSHTLSHERMTEISDEKAMEEIESLNKLLNKLGIPGQAMLRPPYGAYTKYMTENVSVPMIGWNVDSEDWKSKDPEMIYERLVGQVKDGDIVLLHDIHDTTVEALRIVLPALVEDGFQLVTIEEMFEAKGITPKNGKYYFYIR